MLDVKLLVTKVAVTVVAVGSMTVGSLAVAGAGVAGATTLTTNGTQQGIHPAGADRHLACIRDRRHQAFAARSQARFAAGTAKYQAFAAVAQRHGDTRLAKYWQSVVAHRNTTAAHRKANLATWTARTDLHLGKTGATC